MTLYVDGVRVGRTRDGAALATGIVGLGNANIGLSPWRSTTADVRVWKHALPEGAVESVMNQVPVILREPPDEIDSPELKAHFAARDGPPPPEFADEDAEDGGAAEMKWESSSSGSDSSDGEAKGAEDSSDGEDDGDEASATSSGSESTAASDEGSKADDGADGGDGDGDGGDGGGGDEDSG